MSPSHLLTLMVLTWVTLYSGFLKVREVTLRVVTASSLRVTAVTLRVVTGSILRVTGVTMRVVSASRLLMTERCRYCLSDIININDIIDRRHALSKSY